MTKPWEYRAAMTMKPCVNPKELNIVRIKCLCLMGRRDFWKPVDDDGWVVLFFPLLFSALIGVACCRRLAMRKLSLLARWCQCLITKAVSVVAPRNRWKMQVTTKAKKPKDSLANGMFPYSVQPLSIYYESLMGEFNFQSPRFLFFSNGKIKSRLLTWEPTFFYFI